MGNEHLGPFWFKSGTYLIHTPGTLKTVIGFNRDMEPLLATSTQADFLFALGGVGILIGSWFFGRFITAVWRNNPLIWKGGKKQEDAE